MSRLILSLVSVVAAATAGWMGYETGQWHYLAAAALAPLVWLAFRI